MSDTPVLLTLVLPCELEEAVTDLLLSRPDLVAGFSTAVVNGHGSSLPLVEAAERVVGHVCRRRLETVCANAAQAEAVLDLLRAPFAGANIYYWSVPVLQSGRLA
jgi:hypothetical protein